MIGQYNKEVYFKNLRNCNLLIILLFNFFLINNYVTLNLFVVNKI